MVKVSQKAAGWWLTDKICQGGLHIYGKLWGTEDEEKKDNRTIFGDENASAKIQARAKRYKRMAQELMMNINSGLAKKIKLPPPNTSLTIKKESNALLAEHKGNSQKLLSTIKNNLSKQCVPFNRKQQSSSLDVEQQQQAKQGVGILFLRLCHGNV